MTPQPLRVPFLAGLLLVANLAAQTQVLVSTDGPLALLRVNQGACSTTGCPPAGLTTGAPVYAGGTAHDPRDRCTWVTDGTMLAKVNPRNLCAPQCIPIPIPNVPAGSVVTGLAFNEQQQQLFASVSNNTILRFSAVGCALTWLNTCSVVVPSNHIVSGLATDDASNRIFYASSPWNGPSIWPFAAIYEASQATPCSPSCGPQLLTDCSGNPLFTVTGLGFDPCRSELFVTDGRPNLFTMVRTSGCSFLPISCCQPIPPGVRATGACVLPETEQSVGAPCTAGIVPACSPTHSLSGDPAIGNLGFALNLSSAPGGSSYVVGFDLGPCFQPTWISFFCNVIPPSTLCSGFTTGTCNTCTGTAVCPLPIPNNPALCGVRLSTLYYGLHAPCAAFNWGDNWVSNCLQWRITGT